ncbi:MAG: MCE family protein [Bacteroidetes bacterium]|nr:MCE family protein [Bacteroidota bacterium]
METTSKFAGRLGIFVVTGLALLTAGIFYIGKQKHLFNPVFNVNTTFKNISGLEVGNNVRFSGINVGTVENIRIINDTTVKVYMIVDKDVQQFIKTDSYIKISSDGLIGDKIANITQGSTNGRSISEGQHLHSIEPLETDAIIANLSKTGENATVISNELSEILHKVNSGNGTIGRLLHDSTIAENIGQTIRNLKRSSKGLDENMEAAKHNILLRGFFKKKEKTEKDKNNDKKARGKEDNSSIKTEKKETWKERRERKRLERKKKEEATAKNN